jgi:hypothetical protein
MSAIRVLTGQCSPYFNLQVFTREPSLTEWERVRINALRIRRLVAHPNFVSPTLKPSGPVLRQLFALFPPAQLFPNLSALHFGAISRLPEIRSDFLLLRQFLFHELGTLSFDLPVDVPTSEVEQFLGALSAKVSGLRELSITGDHDLPTFNFTVPKLSKLTKLSIVGWDVGLTWQNIPNIQHSHRLQSLSLSVHGPFNIGNPSGNVPLDLSTLKHLSIDGVILQDCTDFLLQVSTPQLSAIDISYNRAANAAQITAVIVSLAASCKTFGSLEQFSLTDYSFTNPQESGPHSLLHSHVFRPLLRYRRLSTVKFGDIGEYCLDDEFIEDVAVAWPGLRELKFASEKLHTTDVSFAAMLSLASKCRSLHSLQLSFDATDFPTLPYAPGGELWPTQTALHELHVGHSTVSEASSFHVLVAVVFPSLARLTYYGQFHVEWRKIEELWKQLLKQREINPALVATWQDSLLQPQS